MENSREIDITNVNKIPYPIADNVFFACVDPVFVFLFLIINKAIHYVK